MFLPQTIWVLFDQHGPVSTWVDRIKLQEHLEGLGAPGEDNASIRSGLTVVRFLRDSSSTFIPEQLQLTGFVDPQEPGGEQP
jgi:hypothetical protein